MIDSTAFNDLIIVKRSGQRVAFNGTKIAITIKKAFDGVYDDYNINNVNKVYSKVLKYINDNYMNRKTINVEDIQNIIETILQQENFSEVRDSFNEYRLKRAVSRELFDQKQQHKFIRATEKIILTAKEEKGCRPIDLLLSFNRTISNEFSKAYLIDTKYVRNHEEGNIYIHNLDYYALGITNSLFTDLSDIKNMDNFFEKAVEILTNLKKEQWEEQSIPALDYLLEPWILMKFKEILANKIKYYYETNGFLEYVKFDEIKRIIQMLNSVDFDISVVENYLLNDKIKSITMTAYKDTLTALEGSVIKNLEYLLTSLNRLDVCLNTKYGYSISLGSNSSINGQYITDCYINLISKLQRLDNVTTIFKLNNPSNAYLEDIVKLILLKKNVALVNPNATYNCKFININNYKTEIEYFSNGERILDSFNEKSQTSIGRILLNKTSINLPRLALKSIDMEDFYRNLDEILELTKNELLQAFDYQANKYRENFQYLFSNNITLESDKLESNQRIRKVLKNGALNINYAGLKECLMILLKKENLEVNDIDLALNIVQFMQSKCDKFTNDSKITIILSETYDSGVLQYLNDIDKTIYGKSRNIANSYQPFFYIFDKLNMSIEERFKIESKLQQFTNGGYHEIVHISKNSPAKKVMSILEDMIKCDIGFLKIVMGKDE